MKAKIIIILRKLPAIKQINVYLKKGKLKKWQMLQMMMKITKKLNQKSSNAKR
jgi:hypothetical protein